MANRHDPAALEEAVNKQAAALKPAQREFVLAEFATFQWNAQKIEKIQRKVDSGKCDPDLEGKLLRERHQIVGEQSALFGHIMKWLKDTASDESELDRFLNG